MPGKTGQSSIFGFGEESAYGTRVAPTRFHEYTQESVKLDRPSIESNSLRAGKRVTKWWVPNRKGAAGQGTFEVATRGFGLLLKHLLGDIATTTPAGGTLSRDHTATLGDLDGQSLTVQISKNQVGGGGADPFDYVGVKIAEWQITNDVDGLLMLQVTFDAQDEHTSEALATASYPADLELFSYLGGLITLDGDAVDVRNVSLSGNNGLKTDRYFLRRSGLKKEQIEDTAPRALSGSFATDYDGLDLYNRFALGEEAALVLNWRGPLIETGKYFEFEVSYPRIRFDGETPNVGGPDVIEQPVQFSALQPLDSSSAVKIRYRTDDAAP